MILSTKPLLTGASLSLMAVMSRPIRTVTQFRLRCTFPLGRDPGLPLGPADMRNPAVLHQRLRIGEDLRRHSLPSRMSTSSTTKITPPIPMPEWPLP
jgi:hypothetical protein